MTSPRLLLLALALAALVGCATKVRVESRPPGALVTLRNGTSSNTPDDVYVGFWPYARKRVIVSSPGYREAPILLRRGIRRVEVVMIPEHGPAGTWTPEGEGLER